MSIRWSKFRIPAIRLYRYKWVLLIAVIWTVLDLLLWAIRASVPDVGTFKESFKEAFNVDNETRSLNYILLRLLVVFLMSTIMGWLIVFKFRTLFRDKPLWINLTMKTLILMACSFGMNFLNLFGYFFLVQKRGFLQSLSVYFRLPAEKFWLIHGLPLWLMIFLITQLFIEMSEKYSPGVFADILAGRYIHPKDENRIIAFIDLKNSTPIAETLGHKMYFTFIRDFIRYVSIALIENDGRIYQYVGDEIVVSWPMTDANADKCIKSLINARKSLQQHSQEFRNKYGVMPEFRVGLHAGEVTIGEIGVIKKDLAMSGDTMNTTARIRSATSELNQKFIASRPFMELTGLKEWQSNNLGSIDLKGKKDALELFALMI